VESIGKMCPVWPYLLLVHHKLNIGHRALAIIKNVVEEMPPKKPGSIYFYFSN